MQLTTLLLSLGCTLFAPKDVDTDGDGLLDSEEEELGLDPDSTDSDGDGLDDMTEVDGETDPLNPDSDGDGFADGEESASGSDPMNKFSWDYDGGVWPDYGETDIVGTGWGLGDVAENFTMTDQFGTELDLYQLAGTVILMDFSAGWCGPCKTVAEGAQEEWSLLREDGFMIVHMMVDDWTGYGVDQEFLGEWADEYGLTFPVVMDPEETGYYGTYYAGLNEGYIPFMILLDQNMEIIGGYTGSGAEVDAIARAEELLGL